MSRSNSTITYTAPNTATGSDGFTVNDGVDSGTVSYSVTVTNSFVNAPTVSGVTNGQTNVGSSITLTGSTPSGVGAFSTILSYTATWNLYTSATYTGTPITQTVTNSTAVTFSGLTANTTYYAQVRYNVSSPYGASSAWSHVSGSGLSFSTKVSFLPSNLVYTSNYFSRTLSSGKYSHDINSDGSIVIMGIAQDPSLTSVLGSVLIFVKSVVNTWNTTVITNSDGGPSFGFMVGMSEDGYTIMATRRNSGGKVYCYKTSDRWNTYTIYGTMTSMANGASWQLLMNKYGSGYMFDGGYYDTLPSGDKTTTGASLYNVGTQTVQLCNQVSLTYSGISLFISSAASGTALKTISTSYTIRQAIISGDNTKIIVVLDDLSVVLYVCLTANWSNGSISSYILNTPTDPSGQFGTGLSIDKTGSTICISNGPMNLRFYQRPDTGWVNGVQSSSVYGVESYCMLSSDGAVLSAVSQSGSSWAKYIYN